MSDIPQTFSKQERLCGEKNTSTLLSRGKYGNEHMLRYCYKAGEGHSRLMISVPKRFFKRAVMRNLLKRRIRESYRRQKGLLEATPADLLIIWNSREVGTYEQVYAEVGSVMGKISRQLRK